MSKVTTNASQAEIVTENEEKHEQFFMKVRFKPAI